MAAAGKIAGLILCGGRSTRMGGGDKCLLPIGGRPILARIVERASMQVAPLALSANGDPLRFAAFGLPVLPDQDVGLAGPLAGILAGLDWAAKAGVADSMASFAGDTPFVPPDLVQRLAAAVDGQPRAVAVATSAGQSHYVFALWPVAIADDLRRFSGTSRSHGVNAFMAGHDVVSVPFPLAVCHSGNVDPFFNINRPEDLAEAERIAGDRSA